MIKYRNGYKSQLAATRTFPTPIIPEAKLDTEFIKLNKIGDLTVLKGYAWDRASGPTFDTKNSVTPSLVHDCFCQLIRQGLLTDPTARLQADKHFYSMLRKRGMFYLRAKLWYAGVRFGARHNTQKPKEILEAP
jgi:hypothetical protein